MALVKPFVLAPALIAVGALLVLPTAAHADYEIQTKLTASDGAAGDSLGSSVSIDGNTMVVGANFADIGGVEDVGAAYVFTRSGDSWSQTAKLTVPGGVGDSVAIKGDTIVAANAFATVDGDEAAGAVYVFTRSGGSWSRTATLTAADGADGDLLGSSVAFNGDVIVAGAPFAGNVGAVYTFAPTGAATRTQTAKLTASGGGVSGLGTSVAVDGDTIVAGAPQDEGFETDTPGAVYTFASTGAATRTQTAKLTASTGYDLLGASVAIDGAGIVAGAPAATVGGIEGAGAVYTFARSGGAPTATLTASDGAANDFDNYLGTSVAIGGDTIAAGASYTDVGPNDNDRGAVYTFARSGAAARTETVKLTDSAGADGDNLGLSVGIDAATDTVVAGAPYDAVGSKVDQGSVVVFETPVPRDPGAFTPVDPARLLDTRTGNGAAKAKVGANGTVSFLVASRGGVPTLGVSAVVLNVTVTAPARAGFATAFPTGTPRPSASNLNFVAGQTIANHVTVQLGAGGSNTGKVSLYNGSGGTVDMFADVAGYYAGGTATEAGTFVPVTPNRLLDTRGNPARVAANGTIPFQVTNTPGIPSDGVSAGVFNVTVTNPVKGGFITAFPTGPTKPDASNLNFVAGQAIPNAATVKLGLGGQVSLFNGSAGTVNLLADVAGYFKSGTASVPGAFTPVDPARLLDTRPGAQVPAKGRVTLTVAGAGNVPDEGAGAAVLNVTVANTGAAGFITAYPAGATQPNASNINFVAGRAIPNLVTVKLSDDGKVTFYNGSTKPVDLLADIAGWYVD